MLTSARTAVAAYLQRIQNYMARGQQARQAEAPPEAFGEPEVVEMEDTVEIRLFAYIESHIMAEMWGLPGSVVVSDVGFLRALDKAKAFKKAIRLRLNSGGGDVFAGVAIANAVRENAIPVSVEGVAASIASVIAAASPHVSMALGATIMVHRPWTCVCGNAEAVRAEADVLDKLQQAMEDIYVSKTGAKFTRAQWQEALRGADGADGSWWTGTEAVANGLADEYQAPEEGFAEEQAKALLEQRQLVAALHGVPLPKNLEELSGLAAPQKTESPATVDCPKDGFRPSVRVSHRPGAFYGPRP